MKQSQNSHSYTVYKALCGCKIHTVDIRNGLVGLNPHSLDLSSHRHYYSEYSGKPYLSFDDVNGNVLNVTLKRLELHPDNAYRYIEPKVINTLVDYGCLEIDIIATMKFVRERKKGEN